jgi:hypothetical protein
MCTTFRVYYYCGHLKRTTYIEHSGIECTETDSKRTVVDEKCPRCVARKPQRDNRLRATLDGNDTPSLAREDAFYDAGDESSASELVQHGNCAGMLYDCNKCPGKDAASVDRQDVRDSEFGVRALQADAKEQTAEQVGQPRLGELQWKCFGTCCNCSRCVRVRGAEYREGMYARGDERRPIRERVGLDEGYRGCGKKGCECALCAFEEATIC